jgi:ABC-type phosphate/phosphonate transport system substrate-binding protein
MQAALPMYDWPEVRWANEALWAALQVSFAKRGIEAPAALSQPGDLLSFWQSADLLLAQTCGLPYATSLRTRVRMVGTPSYDIGCTTGYYYSVLITPAGRPFEGLERFSGRLAVNGPDSQSGYSALLLALSAAQGGAQSDHECWITGSHRRSIEAIAQGHAELAAIDAVSFRLARQHMPEAAAVTVVGCTSPTPGLPLITARPEADLQRMRTAVRDAIGGVDPEIREALFLTGFEVLGEEAYNEIAEAWRLVAERKQPSSKSEIEAAGHG